MQDYGETASTCRLSMHNLLRYELHTALANSDTYFTSLEEIRLNVTVLYCGCFMTSLNHIFQYLGTFTKMMGEKPKRFSEHFLSVNTKGWKKTSSGLLEAINPRKGC